MEYYSALKRMSLQTLKRHGGNLSVFHQVEARLKKPHTMIPTIRHSEKMQNYEDSKKSVVGRGGGKDEGAEHRAFKAVRHSSV